jgi:hypothetical protein
MTILWTTGEPNPVYTEPTGYFDAPKRRYAYYSGYESETKPEVWSAVPFRLDRASHITQLDAYYTGGGPQTSVNYIIWKRDNLSAPTTIAATGTLGPEIAAADTNDLHQHTIDVDLPRGDYYLTIYGAGEPEEAASINWLTGAALQDPSLEQNSMWRSSSFAASGFQPYTFSLTMSVPMPSVSEFFPGLGSFFGGFGGYGGYGGGFGASGGFCCGVGFGPSWGTTYPGHYYQEPRFMTVTVTPNLLADARDVYNPAFTLRGISVPEPSSLALSAITLLGFIASHRPRRSGQ